MIPSFLRRFGAALVCSLVITAAAAPSIATAEDGAAVAKPDAAIPVPSGSAKAEPAPPHDAKSADAKADAAKHDAGKPATVGANTEPQPKAGAAPTGVPTSILKAREEAEREGRRHGSRSKAADGSLLVWDKVNSVWLAAGQKNTYWVDDRYYRFDEGVWLTSKVIAGPWEVTREHLVPEAPRGRHAPPKDSVTARLPTGLEAIYDPRLKVFKIAGRKGVFFFDGVFYRYDGGVWLESAAVDGPWAPCSAVALPQALRRAITPAEKGSRVTLPSGEVLVSEGKPNLFAVDGKPDAIYFDGTFYERRDQKWFKSASMASAWEEISSQDIPGVVRSNYHVGTSNKETRQKEKAAARKGEKSGKQRAGKKAGKKDGAASKRGAAHKAADDESEDEE